MRRLYLHIREGDELIEDIEGKEYSSLNEAREAAIESAREIMSARVRIGKSPDHSAFEITDEAGTVLLAVPFEDAIDQR